MLLNMNFFHKTIIFLFVLKLFVSCKEKDPFVESRIKTAEKFVECLKNNTPDKILDYTYPDTDDKIDDKEAREIEVNRAYEFINKFGLPPKDKWIIKYDPHNNFERLLISIPIFKGHDTILKVRRVNIIMIFPPPQISRYIYHYEVEADYDQSSHKITPVPIIIDTLKKHS
ncbi:MAG TPA: hypothetical protein VK492_05705 [Chitinophagaceae bacterium]|nr:hypothetical protein [Chitinophagaceae bacterium]